MKLVMLVVARDDVDVVDAQLAFHLNAGVDLVIATDHDSTDGTADVLESYARAGYLRRLPQHGEARDDEWRTSMARLALDEHDADWIVDSHVDEFWLPRAEGLKDVLAAIPPRYGAVQALARVFLPRPDDERPFAERLTCRPVVADPKADRSARDLGSTLRPLVRAGRGGALVGTREAVLDGKVPLRAWYPVEALRFPLRSFEQASRRLRGRSGPHGAPSAVEQQLLDADGRVALERVWQEVGVEDADLEQGRYVRDERLRDALRRIEAAPSPERSYALPEGGGDLGLRTPDLAEDARYAAECSALCEIDLDSLYDELRRVEDRVGALEHAPLTRIRRRLARRRGA